MTASVKRMPNENELFCANEEAEKDPRTCLMLLTNENEDGLFSVDEEVDNADELIFADEEVEEIASSVAWKILLVDDDQGVHQATQLALRFFTFENRRLEFISAYSAQEAKRLIPNHSDIALILLDVIMETPDAGLIVAQYIREEIQNKAVRIVLRTGQSGEFPEEEVVIKYDINDYKTKTELTQQKLFTTLVSSLRAYRDLLALEQSHRQLTALNADLQQFNHNLEDLVEARTQELAQKNQQLRHEIAERHKAENALRVYIHALTHDLKNPVCGMVGILRSLLERHLTHVQGELGTQIQIPVSVLKRMSEGCDRQLNMIDSLLNAYAIEVQGVSTQFQSLNLTHLIQTLLVDWRPKLDQKRVRVTQHVDSNLPTIEADPNQIWRVFENLISNALKYNPPGIALTVTAVRSLADSNLVRCAVADTGVGIEAAQRPHIFDLYQRGESSHPTQGLGVGLYTCRRFIEAHGGQMGVNSQSGEGAEFWFTLPITQP